MEAELEAEEAARIAAGLPEVNFEDDGGDSSDLKIGQRTGFKEPPFVYDFGFNPLVTLGEMVRARHPRLRLRRIMSASMAFRLKRSKGIRAITFAAPGPCSADVTVAAATAAAAAARVEGSPTASVQSVAEAVATSSEATLTAARSAGALDNDVSKFLDPRLGAAGQKVATALKTEVPNFALVIFFFPSDFLLSNIPELQESTVLKIPKLYHFH